MFNIMPVWRTIGTMEAPTLFNAAKSYVVAAMVLLSKACPPAPPQRILGLRRWVRDGEAFFERDMEQPYWVQGFLTHLDQLHSLTERDAFVSALRKDPE